MRIDLHVHSAERSWCCRAFEREQIQAAIDAGLDALVITDHNLCVSPTHLARLNQLYAPFRIFGGVEMTLTGRGERNEDIIAIGDFGREIERWNWSRDWAGMHHYVRSCGGFLMLAHPFRYSDQINIDIVRYPVDGLELYSTNITQNARERILELGERLGIKRFFANSDAHDSANIGRYFNSFSANPQTNTQLVHTLLNRQNQLGF